MDPKRKAENEVLKKEIGDRFKQFRKAIKKTQRLLAHELGIYQSTVHNFEKGETFPSIGYLHYFYEEYGLNVHWLLTGESFMFVPDYSQSPDISYVMESSVKYGDPRYNDYIELLKLMQVPIIERVIMTKLDELKITFKNEIGNYISIGQEKKKAR